MTEPIDFITVVPRVRNPADAVPAARRVVRWTDDAELDGVLLFNGAGAVLDPWLGAADVLASSRLHPLVAVNPVYQHPFAAARMVASLVELYGRRVDLNLITGTSLRDLSSLGDTVAHDDRYERLGEYTRILTAVLDSPRPFSLEGRFYQVAHLQLAPRPAGALAPRLFLAGQSPAARALSARIGALGIRMLPEHPGTDGEQAAALHFGVLARPEAEEAAKAADEWFPADPAGEGVVEASMANTDSAWKARLFEQAGQHTGADGYRLAPFRAGQADCPYLVGDYTAVAGRIADFARAGVRTFVVDLPAAEAEYQHFAQVARLVRARPDGPGSVARP